MNKLILVCIIALMTGCVTTSGTKLDSTSINKVHIGDTREQVISKLGNPERVSKSANETVFSYNYTEGAAFGVSTVKILSGKPILTSKYAIITFDANGKVKDVVSNYDK